MIFPHHPETHGTASTPFSNAICVEFIVKGSLHEPSSPLDLQLTHLRRMPVRDATIGTVTFTLRIYIVRSLFQARESVPVLSHRKHTDQLFIFYLLFI